MKTRSGLKSSGECPERKQLKSSWIESLISQPNFSGEKRREWGKHKVRVLNRWRDSNDLKTLWSRIKKIVLLAETSKSSFSSSTAELLLWWAAAVIRYAKSFIFYCLSYHEQRSFCCLYAYGVFTLAGCQMPTKGILLLPPPQMYRGREYKKREITHQLPSQEK